MKIDLKHSKVKEVRGEYPWKYSPRTSFEKPEKEREKVNTYIV